MITRVLSVGEHNIIAHALFLRQEQLRIEAHQASMHAEELSAKYGDDVKTDNANERAKKLHEECNAAFNLELIVRRYTLNLESILVIPELA